MNRVIIVDDEQWAVIGIKKALDWDKYGFQIIGEFNSSVEAFDVICTEKPDLVFTDIKMPVISGIDLMRMTKEREIDTEFVVVSGFAEFSFAQEAIRLGALDYCLKPLDMDKTEELMERLQKHFVQKGSKKNNDVLEAILNSDKIEISSVDSYFTQQANTHWRVAVIYSKDSNIVSDILCENDPLLFTVKIGVDKYLCILKSENVEKLAVLSKEIFQRVKYKSIGVSTISEQSNNMARLIKEADIAAKKSYISREDGIYEYSENVNSIKLYIDKIIQVAKGKKYNELFSIIEEIKEAFRANSLGIFEVAYLWNRVMGSLADMQPETSEFVPEFLNHDEIIERFEDFNQLCKYLIELITYDEKNELYKDDTQYDTNYDRLLKYIQDNFEKDLYLNDISTMFFLNQTYVCQFFKKKLGKTFSEFITELRINKACELIKTTDMGIAEIAVKVGYSDYYYFNKIFKKHCTITPAKYKKKFSDRKSF